MSAFGKQKHSSSKVKVHELKAYTQLRVHEEGDEFTTCGGEQITTDDEEVEVEVEEEEEEEEEEKEREKREKKEKKKDDNVSSKEKYNFLNIKKKYKRKRRKWSVKKQMNKKIMTSEFINKFISRASGENCEYRREGEGKIIPNNDTSFQFGLNNMHQENRIKKRSCFLNTEDCSGYRKLNDTFKKGNYRKRLKGNKLDSNDKKIYKKKSFGNVSRNIQKILLQGYVDNAKKETYYKSRIDVRESNPELMENINEYTNMREKNTMCNNENYSTGHIDIFTDKKGEIYDLDKEENIRKENTDHSKTVYNSEYTNKAYTCTSYCTDLLNDTYYNYNDNVTLDVPLETSSTSNIFLGSDNTNRKIQQTPMNTNLLTTPEPYNQWNKWNINNTKEHDLASYYSQDTYNLNGSDGNEGIQTNNFDLTNVNINDLCNFEEEKKDDKLEKAENGCDALMNTYKKTNTMSILYNFLKRSKKGKKKRKERLELKEINNRQKYKNNCHFFNYKEKVKYKPGHSDIYYQDSCITFGNPKSVEEVHPIERDLKLKYKGLKTKETLDNDIIQEEKKKKKKKKFKDRCRTKISMNILKDIQNNEAVKKWNNFCSIQKLSSDEKKKTKVHVLVFVVFLFLNIFINYDSGILPVSLNKVTDDFNLSVTLQGLIGAMPYIGLTLASFFLGTLLQKYEQKKIIAKSMILNIINIYVTFLCTNKYLFLFLRFIYGITHSVLIIYIPVWTDEYAPSLNLTFWLGLIHISTIIGIAIGYLCTGLLIFFEYSWMYSLLIQGFFLFFFLLILLGIPKRFINISDISKNQNLSNISKYTIFDTDMIDGVNDIEDDMGEGEDSDATNHINRVTKFPVTAPVTPISPNNASTIDASDNNTIIIYISNTADKIKNIDDFNDVADKQASHIIGELRMETDFFRNRKVGIFRNFIYRIKKTYIFSSIAAILRCPLYMWLVCSMCNLFFVVIGIFFWSTKFFTNYLNIGSLEAMFYFIGTSLTAPIIGILMGSKIVDKFIGGYKEYKSRLKTLYFCIFNSFLTSLMALMICIFDNYKFTLTFTWAILLFGAMLLPPITGIILSIVNSERRSFASAFSMFLYNIFGYALGTFFPGFIVDFFNVSEVISIKVVYLWSFLGFFNLCIATIFAKRKKNY